MMNWNVFSLCSFSLFSDQKVGFSASLTDRNYGPAEPETIVFNHVFINRGGGYNSGSGTERLREMCFNVFTTKDPLVERDEAVTPYS